MDLHAGGTGFRGSRHRSDSSPSMNGTAPVSNIRILKPSFQKYWHFIGLAILLSFVAAVTEGFSVGMLIPFLQTISEGGSTFSTGIEWVDIYLLGVEAPLIERMYRICGVILLATWLRALASYFAGVYSTEARVRIVEDLRMRVVDQLQSVALSFFSKRRSGDLLNSILNEINRTATAVIVIFDGIGQTTLLIAYVSVMLWISWELTLIVALFFSLLALGITRLVRNVSECGEELSESSSGFTSTISEYIDGVRTVVAYNSQDRERRRLHKATQRYADAVINVTKRSLMIQPLSQAVISTVLIVLIAYAVQVHVMGGSLSIAFLLTFLFAMFRMMPIAHSLNDLRGKWAANEAGIKRIAELLRRDNKPYLDDGSRVTPPLRTSIAFENVSFGYDEDQSVLSNLNFDIPQGRMTALVGASGAGKSTLVKLLPRFYDPNAGHITWDGTDLRDFQVRTLRDRIAIVSQSTHIFNDTVRANIGYGDPSASEADIRRAAEQANALDFIEEMENGFDTVLGDRGVRLSGGQRQRLSIARALLKDPEILILDEATSDLDSVSERLVQDSLERLMSGRTVIAIAHRLSTIENADHVIVLEDGEVVEQGTYADLIHERGQLWQYHKVQFRAA
jgi:subfamily B ATP-binding cassette protein MsbA